MYSPAPTTALCFFFPFFFWGTLVPTGGKLPEKTRRIPARRISSSAGCAAAEGLVCASVLFLLDLSRVGVVRGFFSPGELVQVSRLL